MAIDPDEFRVRKDETVKLDKWPTAVKPFFSSKEEYQQLLDEDVKALSAQQMMLYANSTYALLLIFQGMDAAGKDGAIKHVMTGVNPQGCQVYAFKQPSAEELAHDFLWRTTCRLPERGRIGIFNRSYYEEVLVVRVHPELLTHEGIPADLLDTQTIWQQRYHSMTTLEKHLTRNGTVMVKIFLHLSPEEQRKRFLARIDHPDKNWKFSLADIQERQYWPQYMEAYEDCLSATSTKEAPWYIVPADNKENARLIISCILLTTLNALHLSSPEPDAQRREELQAMKQSLVG